MNGSDIQNLSIEALENGEIDAGCFNHEAHVYLAWLYLSRFPVQEAIARFASALKRMTAKLGVPGKYHDTITWFFLLVIAERRQNDRIGGSWEGFRRDNDDLFRRDDNILHRYYSRERLESDEARESFMLPDRLVA